MSNTTNTAATTTTSTFGLVMPANELRKYGYLSFDGVLNIDDDQMYRYNVLENDENVSISYDESDTVDFSAQDKRDLENDFVFYKALKQPNKSNEKPYKNIMELVNELVRDICFDDYHDENDAENFTWDYAIPAWLTIEPEEE